MLSSNGNITAGTPRIDVVMKLAQWIGTKIVSQNAREIPKSLAIQ